MEEVEEVEEVVGEAAAAVVGAAASARWVVLGALVAASRVEVGARV